MAAVLEWAGDDEEHFYNATSMFDVARMLGDALREVKSRDGAFLMQDIRASSDCFSPSLWAINRATP